MEIASIKGDTVLLLYHPAETTADVGQLFSVLETPTHTEGLVVQVISNDSLEYIGLQQEMIQKILESRIGQVENAVNRELGMGEIKCLKLATAKIRKRIQNNTWRTWDGWIPTRNVDIVNIDPNNLLGQVFRDVRNPITGIASYQNTDIRFDGSKLDMINVVTGVKGSGKSHLAKHLVMALSSRNVPCIIYDINGEYIGLPGAQVLRWGNNFFPSLSEVGYRMLETIIRNIYPLSPNSASEGVFETQLRAFFRGERQNIDIPWLRDQNWGGGSYVEEAIDRRLEMINNMNLFWQTSMGNDNRISLATIYNNACNNHPIVFDMRELSSTLQQALVKAINQLIENICNTETTSNQGRYPYIFFEEAHYYADEDAILNIMTRGRHIGIASVFVTNTPQKLPDGVFRQLDNLFLLGLTHKDDIKNVSKNSFTDEETIQSFATRMPEHHALIMGKITDRYPLVFRINDFPAGTPQSGRTRSTWDRLAPNQPQAQPQGNP